MEKKLGNKCMSVLVIGIMVLSGFLIAVSMNVSTGSTEVTNAETNEVLPENNAAIEEQSIETEKPTEPLAKIEPSLREMVLNKDKGMIEVVIETTNMAELAPILNKYGARKLVVDDARNKGNMQFKAGRNNGILVSQRVVVPNEALIEVASLPGVVLVHKPRTPVPDNLSPLEINGITYSKDDLKQKLTERPGVKPTNWPTVVEHKATDVWDTLGYDGEGVNIAIVDTGTDFAQPNLMGQWAVVDDPTSPYDGWPIMAHLGSMDLMMGLFTTGSDWDRYPYPIYASYGESSWYSDTVYEGTVDPTGHVNYTNMDPDTGYQYTKRYDPDGYGGVPNTARIDRSYNVSGITSASGVYHLGIAKDDDLTGIHGERVGVLVVDSTTSGVYDTVYVDLNNDLDFTDENACTKASPLAYHDLDGDGLPDISGGVLYFISNTTRIIPNEVVIDGALGDETSAMLDYGKITADVYSFDMYLPTLYLDGMYWPSACEDIYEDLITDAVGNEKDTSQFLTEGINLMSWETVNSAWVLENYSLEMIYAICAGNATDEWDLIEGVDFEIDMTSGEITWLHDFEAHDYVYIIYEFDTWTVDFLSGEITFNAPPVAGSSVTASYETGLPLPYSTTFAERHGYDLFVPASGDVVLFYGDFNFGAYHGTATASTAVGDYAGISSGILDTYGPAPGAKIVGVELFDSPSVSDTWHFAVEGYDGLPGTGDEAMVVSNSWGWVDAPEVGWEFESRFKYDLMTSYAPQSIFVQSVGNEGPGYGTVSSPTAPPSIQVGAGRSGDIMWLLGVCGGDAYYTWPLIGEGVFGPGPYGDAAFFSSRGPNAIGTPDVDILAVGARGIAGIPVNQVFPWGGAEAWDPLFGGTSQSAPVVAGILALMIEAYNDTHLGYPTPELLQNVLKSTADDIHQDILVQGAGWANALRATKAMIEIKGVVSDTTEWVPGGYKGVHRDMFINFLNPGETDTKTITLTNDGAATATVTISNETYKKLDTEFTFDWLHANVASEYRILNETGLYYTDGTLIKAEDISSAWSQADFLKVTIYSDPNIGQQTPALLIHDWYDTPHFTDNETFAHSTITNVDNETVIVGQFGETKAYVDYTPVLAGTYFFYSNGTEMTESVDYTFNTTTGQINFLTPLGDGEVINATYDWYVPVGAGDPYQIDHPVITSVIGVYLNGVEWPKDGGNNWTLNPTTGIITLGNDTSPGDVLKITYTWDNPDQWDRGFEESAFFSLDEVTGSRIVPVTIHSPASRVHDGLGLRYTFLVGSNDGTPIPAKGVVEFYKRMDWELLSIDETTLNIPAGESRTFSATVNVPEDAQVGSYQGAIYYSDGSNTTTIPILVNVPETSFPVNFGDGTPTTSLYDNNAFSTGSVSSTQGDSRFFWVDTTLMEADNRKMLFDLWWDNASSDAEILTLVSETDDEFTDDSVYGPSTFTLGEATKRGVGIRDTLVPGTEFLDTDIIPDMFGVLIEGLQTTIPMEPFGGDVGYMQVTNSEPHISTNKLSGSTPISLFANVPLRDGLGTAVTQVLSTVFEEQALDLYPYPGGSFIEYLANAPNEVKTVVPPDTISVSWSLYFYHGANDVDMGVFYDADGDGVVTAADDVIGSVAATGANPEKASLLFPEAGDYIVKAAGYDVAAGSLFDLTFVLNIIGVSAFSAENGPTTTVPANTPTGFDLSWDFEGLAEGSMETYLFVSPGHAPYALVQGIRIGFLYDLTPPIISDPAPKGIINDDMPTLMVNLFDYDNGQLVQASVKMFVDGVDVTDYISVSMPYDRTTKYGVGAVSYTPTTPFSDGTHSATAEVSDLAGNIATCTWDFVVDTGAPRLTIDSPSADIVTNSATITISGTTEPSATLTIPSRNDTAVSVNDDGTFSTVVELLEGENAIQFKAVDVAENIATLTRTITLDTATPSFLGITTSKTLTNEEDVIISGRINEYATLTVNGESVMVYADGTFSTIVDLVEGTNTITLVANDMAGNTYSDTITVTKDTIAPTLAVDSLPTMVREGTITVSGTSNGQVVTINGQVVVLTNGAFSKGIELSYGANTIVVTSMDSAGNIQELNYAIEFAPLQVNYGPIVLMVILLIIGLLIGYFIGGIPKAPAVEEMPEEEIEEEIPVEEDILEELPEEVPEEELAEEEILKEEEVVEGEELKEEEL